MKWFFLCFSLLFVISCTTRYFPVEGGDVTVQDDFGIVRKESMILIVQHKYWNVEPKRVSDFFDTFHISIHNRTDAILEIDSGDMFLLDEEGNQFDPVPIKYVEKLLLPDELRFEHITDLSERQPQIIEDWQLAKGNLMRDSFHFGRILPNARRSGYVFFSKLSSSNKQCNIVFQDMTIPFRRSDYKKK